MYKVFFIFLIFFNLTCVGQSIQELKEDLKNAKSDSQRMSLYYELSSEYQFNDNEKAISYAEQLLELAKKKKDTTNIVYGKAMIAYSYYNLGALDKSLKINLEAHEIAKTSKNEKLIDYIITHLALIYDEMGNYGKALEYYRYNIHYAKENDLPQDQMIGLLNIADMYVRMEEYDSAEYYAEKAIKFEEESEEYVRSIAYINYGVALEKNNKFDKALIYLLRGLEIQYTSSPDFAAISEAYVTISNIYVKKKQLINALQFADSSINSAKKSESNYYLRKGYELRSSIHKSLGDNAKAYNDLKKYVETNDKIYNEETTEKFLELQELYEAKQREAEINLLKQESELSKESITQKNIVIIGSLIILLLLALFLALYISRNRLKQKALTLLDAQKREIEERNFQLGEMTEELKSQKEEIETHRDQLSEAYGILEKRNQDVTDSINYAQKIQNSLLPDLKTIKKALPQSFIFYKARDIVSGDFYWFHQKSINGKDIKFIASIDCTGHGVPGAFMSMIADALLSQVIIELDYNEPAKILTEMDRRLRIMLKQDESYGNDGMEIGLCTIYDGKMEFSGAGHKLIYFENGDINILKDNRYSIGESFISHQKMNFTNHTISIDSPKMFYLFSDGIQDQFGGPKDKKLGIKHLRRNLTSIHQDSIHLQERHIKAMVENWKGTEEQVDDMLLIGFRLT
ncbi:SpoIIE family protein phosphatase [Marivirga tractuosa]|uniref:Protein serine/threonine phosphatase n=1 Tax=Marivirga tractuosa (strain ATCC 23168 / DSM 4126 / NBRC 15989 / NCIMB 1408 / VKM B-1430 / H-43) TaxID=643867 RepID=E4TNC1_MARTH|nr:SpoIIE family protein phosphatase [Marivirga tractuosa]ADR23509.1 protein serine/threonine phosphatase [Marivirga tractuosa DSM 4126]